MDEWVGGQKYSHLTAKISQVHWSPNFLTLGAAPCMLHAHESSAKKMVEDWLICINKVSIGWLCSHGTRGIFKLADKYDQTLHSHYALS